MIGTRDKKVPPFDRYDFGTVLDHLVMHATSSIRGKPDPHPACITPHNVCRYRMEGDENNPEVFHETRWQAMSAKWQDLPRVLDNSRGVVRNCNTVMMRVIGNNEAYSKSLVVTVH